MKKPKLEIKSKCNKCGKPQPIDKKESNENWKVYKANQKCECGGTFEMVLI
jgi:hypothetical protein